MKHVTDNPDEHLERNPFPELHRPPSQISDSSPRHKTEDSSARENSSRSRSPKSFLSPARSDVDKYKSNEAVAEVEVKEGHAESLPDITTGEQDEAKVRIRPMFLSLFSPELMILRTSLGSS